MQRKIIMSITTLNSAVQISADSKRAVIMGASLAGILTAQAISEFYDEVWIFDLGEIPTEKAHRKVTPQSQHPHAVKERGLRNIEKLFPGFLAEGKTLGATELDSFNEVDFYRGPFKLFNSPSASKVLLLSRTGIEHILRTRILKNEKVTFFEKSKVNSIELDLTKTNIVAALVETAEGSFRIPCKTFFDCSGRSSPMPKILERIGKQSPKEDIVKVSIRYSTVVVDKVPTDIAGPRAVLYISTRDFPRNGHALIQEDNSYIVSLGLHGQWGAPPTNSEEFTKMAEALYPEISYILRSGQVRDKPIGYFYPFSIRRRYFDLPDLPQGLIVLGDSIVSMNPIYGQGIAMAANSAIILKESLEKNRNSFQKSYYKDVQRMIFSPWLLTKLGDFQAIDIKVQFYFLWRTVDFFTTLLFNASASDPVVAKTLKKVDQGDGEIWELFYPRIGFRVVRANIVKIFQRKKTS